VVKVSRILHAGYVIECEGTRIAFDPIFENPFSVNCHAFPSVQFDRDAIRSVHFDAVFISHFHDDHCSLVSLDLLNRETPVYLYCIHEELFALIRRMGFSKVRPVDLGAAIAIGSIEVVPRRALDSDVDSIFHIKAGGVNLLNVVDSWIDPQTLQNLALLAPWDLVLWPFQTMREIEVLAPARNVPASREIPPEWIEQLRLLNPRFVVPSACQFRFEDWSWYNRAYFPISYKGFQKQIESAVPGVRCIRMNPSVSMTLDESSICPAESLGWIRPVGPQDVDYEFDDEAIPQSTRDIAKRFPALEESAMKRVEEFCTQEISRRFTALEETGDPYFSSVRSWRLEVFDHTGRPTSYDYAIHGVNLESKENGAVDWTTEISAYKLFRALESGESLTSLYLRVNDPEFEEVTDDPLIRCLYTGSAVGFQKNQLRILEH
jgi:L-ascorbate metabolism protein UlaG (beta-lactamase superfamily)